ncbi:hypothetical protein Gotri_000805, partial [Gossypium trilobum]|nr:hypothetical protein [Gossypium trilobum]
MGAGTYPNSDVADAFVAEASACERAVIFATEMGFRDVHFERDSLTVIKKIYSREEDKSVLREASTAAHALAGEGRRYQEAVYWIEKAPYVVDQIVAEDWVQWLRRGVDSNSQLCGVEKLYLVLHG